MTPKQALRSVKANQARKAVRKADLEAAKQARWSLPIERHADRPGLFYSDGSPIDKDDPRLDAFRIDWPRHAPARGGVSWLGL